MSAERKATEMDIDLDEISNQAVAALKSIGRKRVSMQATVALELVRRLRAAEAEAMKSERRAIEFGDIVHRYTLAMRAAVVAATLFTGTPWPCAPRSSRRISKASTTACGGSTTRWQAPATFPISTMPAPRAAPRLCLTWSWPSTKRFVRRIRHRLLNPVKAGSKS